MKFFRRLYIPFLLILTSALACFYYNTMVNGHYHIDNNGQIVYHFHPNSDSEESESPFAEHKHSDLEYTIFDMLTNSQFLFVVAIALTLMAVARFKQKIVAFSESYTSTKLRSYILLRGPPAVA
jgi:hypothetical protein